MLTSGPIKLISRSNMLTSRPDKLISGPSKLISGPIKPTSRPNKLTSEPKTFVISVCESDQFFKHGLRVTTHMLNTCKS